MTVEQPKHGARFVFELLDAEGPRARYRVIVAEEGVETVLGAELDATASRVAPLSAEPPLSPWIEKTTLAFLDVIQRGYEPEAGWPRRMQRWRAPR